MTRELECKSSEITSGLTPEFHDGLKCRATIKRSDNLSGYSCVKEVELLDLIFTPLFLLSIISFHNEFKSTKNKETEVLKTLIAKFCIKLLSREEQMIQDQIETIIYQTHFGYKGSNKGTH